MTLTEQWEKGELEDGTYWVMLDVSGDGKIMQTTLSISNGKPVGWCKKSIKEILAPVPSYEEWQQLKEMLYKCREKLDWLNGGYDVWGGELTDFIEEIDNAIGEKK